MGRLSGGLRLTEWPVVPERTGSVAASSDGIDHVFPANTLNAHGFDALFGGGFPAKGLFHEFDDVGRGEAPEAGG